MRIGKRYKRLFILLVILLLCLILGCSEKETEEPEIIETEVIGEGYSENVSKTSSIGYGIYNGSGVPGLASDFAEKMKLDGYNTIEVGNYDSFDIEKCEVRYRDEKDKEAALIIAEMYNVSNDIVISSELAAGVDVAFIIGKDMDPHALVVSTIETTTGTDDDFDFRTVPVKIKLRAPSRSLENGIYISKSDHCLTYFEMGKPVKHYPIATGRNISPTPEGEFTISIRLEDPVWYWKGKEIPPGPDNGLGSRFIGITNTDNPKGYGVHGTNEPDSIGRDVSHGCVRMSNKDVEELFEKVRAGDTVVIGE